ncbi:MAG: phage tail tube protein [Desulfobacteraceae bacterium]|nr:phage tail tube protein [Desulfobacteraceae bacterium]
MAQQKGSTAAVLIGVQSDISTKATAAVKVPFNTCDVMPQQAINKPGTMTGGRNPVAPFRGNKDVGGSSVIPVDGRAMWYWLQLMFGNPTTAGGTAAAWVALTNYAAGALVIPTVANGRYYEATADAGSAGASEPTWPTTVGATVVDGGITWTCRAFVHEFKVPASQPYFTLEKQLADLTTTFEKYIGCKISSFAIEVGGDGELVATINVMGANLDFNDTTSIDSSPTDATAMIDRVANFQAAILEAGSPLANARTISINVDMDLDGDQFVIGGGGVRGDIPEGVVGVSGQLVVLCDDAAFALITKGINVTESSIKLTITDTTTNIFEIELQEVEFAVAGTPINTPRGLVVTLNYQGFYTNGSEASVVVMRLTNIDQHGA